MPSRRVFLAKYRTSTSQRAHFAIFVPNETDDRATLAEDFRRAGTSGTVIHVLGEPLMSGYKHEFKRNYEASTSRELSELIFLGTTDVTNIFERPSDRMVKDDTPRGRLETEAVAVTPPPRGQNLRAPVDGVINKRCQEWTIEFLQRLVSKGLIQGEAVERAQAHRDPPSHGIVGANRSAAQPGSARQNVVAGSQQAISGSSGATGNPTGQDRVWDVDHERYRRWNGQRWLWCSE